MAVRMLRSLRQFAAVATAACCLAACAGEPVAPLAVVPDSLLDTTSPINIPPIEPSAEEIAQIGERLYVERCSTCHEGGRAPSRSQIAANSPRDILEALDTGFMAPIAMFMSTREKTIIAHHLSGRAG